jgi:formiminotetrahydrofolate cyclodeaminase
MPTLRDSTLGTYLDDVSSARPTPGGGSVAAVVGALGSALGVMVTAIASAKSKSDQIDALATACIQARETFLRLSREDQSAFDAVMAALKLPKDDATRSQQVESTVQTAAQVPLSIAQACVDLLGTLESLVPLASRHSVSDIGAASHFALAAMRSSLLNVAINVTFMKDRSLAATFESAAAQLESEGASRSQRVADQVLRLIRGS